MLRKAPTAGTICALWLMAAGAASWAADDCGYGQMHPAAPPQTRQFEFLIGDFAMSLHAWQGDGWSPPRPAGAHWRGWWGLNGMAIYDEWYDPGPGDPDGTWGVNVRVFDPAAGLWRMMWISIPQRQVQELRARLDDGTLTMRQIQPQRPDWKAEFEVADADHWARVAYVREDADAPWTPQYRLAATRIPCDPAAD